MATNCIPQHYLSLPHSKESVEIIPLAEISYYSSYLAICCTEAFFKLGWSYSSKSELLASTKLHECTITRQPKKFVYASALGVLNHSFLLSEIITDGIFSDYWRTRGIESSRATQITTIITKRQRLRFSCHHDLPINVMSGKTNTIDETGHIKPSSPCKRCIAKITVRRAVYFELIRAFTIK